MIGMLPYGIPVLLGIFFPFLQDYYDTGRWIAISVVTLLVLCIWTIELIRTKKLIKPIPPVTIGFGALTFAATISVLVASTNKIEAITHPLGVVTYLCLTLLSFLLAQLFTKEQKQTMLWSTLVVIGTIGLITVYQQFAITSILFPNATYLTSKLWNPTGTPISALYLFALGIPLALWLMRTSFKQHKEKHAALAIVSLVFMVVGAIVTCIRFIPLIPTVVMPISIGWSVLLETLKTAKAALTGCGAENFLSAYALGRPVSINQTALWNTGFSTNATLLLHLGTTLGLTGILAGITLIVSIVKSIPKTGALRLFWLCSILVILCLPPSIPFLLLIVIVAVGELQEPTHHESIAPWIRVAVGIIVVGSTAFSLFGIYRFTNAEILYNRAGNAVETEQNLTKAYTNYVYAIKQNPFMTRYHISLSQLALVMGGSILSSAPKNETTGAVTLLDEDKQLVTSLFGLAVSEAKLATTLAPGNYVAWTNLATIYQSLAGVATDATNWTVAAYQKAISVNPVSPMLRIDFGGVYMNAKDYDNAIAQFTNAITLKPNYANAYYNLANAYKMKGDYTNALVALQKTQGLLPTTGDEYTKVTEEIRTLQQTPSGYAPNPTPTPTPKAQQPITPLIPQE